MTAHEIAQAEVLRQKMRHWWWRWRPVTRAQSRRLQHSCDHTGVDGTPQWVVTWRGSFCHICGIDRDFWEWNEAKRQLTARIEELKRIMRPGILVHRGTKKAS